MASVVGTKRFFQKFGVSKVLKNQWTCGRLGFGGARLEIDKSEHQYALQYAIQGGCNIIDTSDYWGTSEALVDRVLTGMISENVIRRDEIILSKRIKSTSVIPKDIKADVLFLDKPEILTRGDFENMEKLVAGGNIQYYGLSLLNIDENKISQYLDMAKQVSKSHHFQFLQVPFNFHEKQLLKANGLESFNVFTNRPFYTLYNDVVTPILELEQKPEKSLEENVMYLNGQLNQLISYEKNHRNEFMWGHKIGENLDQITNMIALQELRLEIDETLEDMEREHRLLLNDTLKNVHLVLECKNHLQAEELNKTLRELIPGNETWHAQNLQQKIIQILSGSSKCDSVLVGMRSPTYVKDLLFPLAFQAPMDPKLCDLVIERVNWVDIPFSYNDEKIEEIKTV